MRTITLEEHFATPAFLDGPGRDLKEQAEKFDNARAKKVIPELCDLGDKRIAAMDAAGVDMQIVSLTAPGVEQLETAAAPALVRDTNDFLAAAIKKNPKRIGGFAALPTGEPDKAAQELEQRVREQNFAGAVEKSRRGKVLFERDGAHGPSPRRLAGRMPCKKMQRGQARRWAQPFAVARNRG